jgi:hypothetical protein
VVSAATEGKTSTTSASRDALLLQPAQLQTLPAAAPYRGALALSSSPAGAEVVLNGTVVGATPVVLGDLPIGARTIVMRHEGYTPWSASIGVVANQRTNVSATLLPAQ